MHPVGMDDFPPDQLLVLRHASGESRAALAALLLLDRRLGDIVRGATSPLAAQLKLTWWRDALARLDDHPAPPEPILQAIATEICARGGRGSALAAIAEGWMVLLAEDHATVPVSEEYAELRGRTMFAAAAGVLGAAADGAVADAGKAWALAYLSRHVAGRADADAIRLRAVEAADRAFGGRWERVLRPIGTLSLLSAMELNETSSIARLSKLLKFQLFGR